eukprot:13075533-Alexandrium_andersonii.AAC.2
MFLEAPTCKNTNSGGVRPVGWSGPCGLRSCAGKHPVNGWRCCSGSRASRSASEGLSNPTIPQ